MASTRGPLGEPVRSAPDGVVPPHPFDSEWHVHADGKTYGPFTGHKIQQMIGKRQIAESDLVFLKGGSAWVQAKDDPILATLFRPQENNLNTAAIDLLRTAGDRKRQPIVRRPIVAVAALLVLVLLAALLQTHPTKNGVETAQIQVKETKLPAEVKPFVMAWALGRRCGDQLGPLLGDVYEVNPVLVRGWIKHEGMKIGWSYDEPAVDAARTRYRSEFDRGGLRDSCATVTSLVLQMNRCVTPPDPKQAMNISCD